MAGEVARERMTVAAFLEWASRRPDGERWELIEGAPVRRYAGPRRHRPRLRRR